MVYAYSMTADGFQSLFPSTERDVKVALTYDLPDQPINLEVTGLPDSLQAQQMSEFTIRAKNTSNRSVAIKPGQWFEIESKHGGLDMSYKISDRRESLEPGEAISQTVQFVVMEPEMDFEMLCRFVPHEPAKGTP